jgi:Xaa-Pro aminopeptidase
MIVKSEYQKRRTAFINKMGTDSIAIIAASKLSRRNGDVTYRFRQNSNFYYLTGFNEPEAILIFSAEATILFNRAHDAILAKWEGAVLGQDNVPEKLGIEHSYEITSFATKLPEILAGKRKIYYSLGEDQELDKTIISAWQTVTRQNRSGIIAPNAICQTHNIFEDLRVIKSDAEINLMRKAINYSVVAHQNTMKMASQVNFEYQLEAEFMYSLLQHGVRNLAYEPIVASGHNNCILHYTNNHATIHDDSLILIDAGCEYDNYASDITRTYPKLGVFTSPQEAIYKIVLEAHDEALKLIKPGCLWNTLQDLIIRIITQGLIDLKILSGKLADCIAQKKYQEFYMHNFGHWLGLDVHDCGSYKIDNDWRSLEPNMLLTLEPGIYIAADNENVDPRWRGIGIRIENDILVTQNSCENISQELPVTIKDIRDIIHG